MKHIMLYSGLKLDLTDDGWQCSDPAIAQAVNTLYKIYLSETKPADGDPNRAAFDRMVNTFMPSAVVYDEDAMPQPADTIN